MRLQPRLLGSAIHVYGASQGGMERLPHSVGVGDEVAEVVDGVVLVVGVGHLVWDGFPPHLAAQRTAARFSHLHFWGNGK